VEKRFRALHWHNAPKYETWRKDIESVRRKGYSIDRATTSTGVVIVAVPVLTTQQTISHTIVAIGLGDQLDQATPFRWRRTCARGGNGGIADDSQP